jgi:hypothetical protein
MAFFKQKSVRDRSNSLSREVETLRSQRMDAEKLSRLHMAKERELSRLKKAKAAGPKTFIQKVGRGLDEFSRQQPTKKGKKKGKSFSKARDDLFDDFF